MLSMVVQKFSGSNFGFVTLLVASVLVIVAASPTEGDVPHYRLKFGVFYNSSGVDDVTKPCGAYYAETFLGKFMLSQVWMMEECNRQVPGHGVNIQIQNRARVNIYNLQVEVSVDISFHAAGGSRENLSACGSVVNQSLQMPETVSSFSHGESFIDSLRNLDEKESKNCSAAIMSPPWFFFLQGVWVCDNTNYTFSSPNLACVENGDSEGTDSQTSGVLNPSSYDTKGGSITQQAVTLDENQDLSTIAPQIVTARPSNQPVTSLSGVTTSRPESVTPQDESVTNSNNLSRYGNIELLRSRSGSTITLSEGGPEATLDVRLWADKQEFCKDAGPDCRVTFNISIAKGEYTGPKCRKTGQLMEQVVFGQPSRGHASGTPFCSLVIPANTTRQDPLTTSLSLRAVSDNKYDGTQRRQLTLSLTVTRRSEVAVFTFHRINVTVLDQDREATCQSINDPHITTFDGFEYNNFYEGEFVFYKHKELPATVHVVYQRCSPSIPASCNCAVAVQSGDDVLVIDRCYREREQLPLRPGGHHKEINPMSVQLYLNGRLTPGTRVYQEADGKKYYVYLPHGTYVKVLVSGLLVNVWVVASPADLYKTQGLCGMYDKDRQTDMVFPNGTLYTNSSAEPDSRPQPEPMMLSWRVDIDSEDSLLRGVPRAETVYDPPQYCQCVENDKDPRCGYSVHVDHCDNIQGVDVTDMLVRTAVKLTPPSDKRARTRGKRDISDNTIRDDPMVNKNFKPPKYKWKDSSHWNAATSKNYCTDFILTNYTLGRICSEVLTADNIKNEITTCQEDIRITHDTTFAISAREAMKEKCLEEVRKRGNLSEQMVDQIFDYMCSNDCSGHGNCHHGTCHCEAGYTSADCSVSTHQPPYAGGILPYGGCNIRTRNCTHVIVYGDNFVDSDSLTCFFQPCEVDDDIVPLSDEQIRTKAIFINFQAVECTLPDVNPYLIRVSNNGGLEKSDHLLFLPFDPQCRKCTIGLSNATCTKVRNSCIIDRLCYSEGQSSPKDECLVCEPVNSELQWTTLPGKKCETPWWNNFKLPSWAVAVPAAIGGSIVGVLAGFLLYKCCCKNHKYRHPCSTDLVTHNVPEDSPFEDAILHRNRGLPVFSSDRFSEIDIPRHDQSDYRESFFYNDGRGVENGVDSTTYF